MESNPSPTPALTQASAPLAVAPPQAMDVVTPPPQTAADKSQAQKPVETPAAAPVVTSPKAVPKPARTGVTAAITATVIIVLGLAVLTVIAFIKTK